MDAWQGIGWGCVSAVAPINGPRTGQLADRRCHLGPEPEKITDASPVGPNEGDTLVVGAAGNGRKS